MSCMFELVMTSFETVPLLQANLRQHFGLRGEILSRTADGNGLNGHSNQGGC